MENKVNLQRAEGFFEIIVNKPDARTQYKTLRQKGCSRLLFPRRNVSQLESVMVNISGGVAAGDRLYGKIICHEGTDLLMSTQAHERVYRARLNEYPATAEIICHLSPHSRLEWLPHGTIFFNESCFKRHMKVNMTKTSKFLFYESRIFGRSGSDERLCNFYLNDKLSIVRDGCSILEESVVMEGNNMQNFLHHAAVADGACADMTLIIVEESVDLLLPRVRSLLTHEIEGSSFAASCWNGMLVIRGLSRSNLVIEQLMNRLLRVIRAESAMPAGWRI